MLSHVEMAPAAGGFKLFGKVITQCAEGDAAAPAQGAPVFVALEEELAEEWPAASTPRPHGERERATIKREAAGHEEKQQQGGETESGGGQPPRRTQQQAAAEARAAAAAPLPCPRCRSRDTKFCYFNNYNVNQPRHFCKACHRYWTAGGALRNVPVGAGRRKNRPLGPVATVAGYQHHRAAAAGATGTGFFLGFPNPSSPTSPSPVYTDRWPVGSDRRF